MVHLFATIIPEHIVLQEFAFQTVNDGTHPKLVKPKRKGWPKFPLTLNYLVLQISTHVAMLGKEITTMNLVESPKRMHDPISYLA